MARDVSWKSRLSTLNDENVLLKTQVDSIVKERENIKPEYQKLFNSIKATQAQHQKELNELIEHVNQKTYAYADGKNVNTKFDKSETSGTLLCVTPFPKSIAVKAKKVSITKVNTDRSKPVTSHSIPKNEQSQKQNANVITKGMYRITKTKTHMPVSKANTHVSNSTGVESSNSVRRAKSKDNKSKNRALKNTNNKSSSIHVWKVSSSVSIDSNKHETMNSTVCQSNTSVLKTKTLIDVNDGSNIVCVSYGKDVFMLSHEKCLALYALLEILVLKSRLSVAKTPTATNNVSSTLSLSPDSSQEGDDLLTGSRESNLYTISISKLVASSPICLMSKATSTKSWLWYRTLSHLNFGTINQLTSKDLVDGLLKFKYDKDHLCLACEQGKSKKASFLPKLNRYIVHTQYNKTPYELIHERKPNVQYFYVFGSLCYPINDHDDLGKMKPKADIGIFIGYSKSSRGFRIYICQTKKIMETIHVKFDELTTMASECNNSGSGLNCSNFQDSSDDMNEISSQQDLDNLFGPLYEEYYVPNTSEVLDNSTVITLDVEDTLSPSSIIVEDSDALQIVTSLEESITQESSIPVLET
ncbi:retrovirus-related pol polyprotein from transposon TNT 1-94 [Tanacetum coccineum]